MVNISSMLGCMVNLVCFLYCIIKFGVEVFLDCLCYEMCFLGVKVSVVEFGNFIVVISFYSFESIWVIVKKMWDELFEVVCKDYGKKYFDEKIVKMEIYCSSGFIDMFFVIDVVIYVLIVIIFYICYYFMDYYWWL